MRRWIAGFIIMMLGGVVGLPAFQSAHANPTPQETFGVECDYDLSGETVKFYHFGDLSNIYAFITQPVLAGFEDAVTYFNENGGICGATIEQEYRDTGASPEAAQAAWDDFAGRDDVNAIFLYLTEDAELLREQAAQARIPIIGATGSVTALYGDDGQTPGYVFAITPLYSDQLGAFCDYISTNWEQFGIEGDPVIGHVSWLNAFGQASDTPESRAYCESVGVGYARAMYFFPGIPDIAPQIEAVVEAGANIIYTTSLGTSPAQVASTVQALGLNEDVVLAGPNWVLDTSIINTGGEAVAGMIGQLPYIWWDEVEHPGIQIPLAYWAENRLGTAEDPTEALALRNIAYLVAWAGADIYAQIYIETVNRVGPGNVNGEAMYETLISGQTFSGLGGVLVLNFSETRRATNQTRIGSIQFVERENGVTPTILPLTDFYEVPDLSPGGEDVPE